MNNVTHSAHSTSRARAWWTVGSIATAGFLAWGATAFADSPKVTVKVDEQPIAQSAGGGETTSFAPVVKRVAPSVVKVFVTERAKNVAAAELPPFMNDPLFRQFFGNQFGNGNRQTLRQPPQEGMGSGVIVSADGYVLTNNHVVNGADAIKVSLNDGREFAAKIVGTDPQADLAVIKVEATDLPAIVFADSEKLEVGDRVLAIGNPFGIGQTVTSGMVSGLSRTMPGLGLDYEDFIQTDAAINPGNSGGALVDVKGRLVGINTAILSRTGGFQGIGFAIPGNLARNVMEQLVADGKVSRGFIGVMIQDLTPELAKQFGLEVRKGALVGDVSNDGPAAKAGLKSGDIITKFAGKDVNDSRHLKLTVATYAAGKEVPVEVLRDGKTVKLTIKVGTQPKDGSIAKNGSRRGNDGLAPSDDSGTLNGVGVADLDSRARREFDVPARVKGALVTEVDPNSAAAAVGLQPGDVIQEINRQPVNGAEDAVKLTENPESKKTLLRVWSQRGSRYVIVDETDVDGKS